MICNHLLPNSVFTAAVSTNFRVFSLLHFSSLCRTTRNLDMKLSLQQLFEEAWMSSLSENDAHTHRQADYWDHIITTNQAVMVFSLVSVIRHKCTLMKTHWLHGYQASSSHSFAGCLCLKCIAPKQTTGIMFQVSSVRCFHENIWQIQYIVCTANMLKIKKWIRWTQRLPNSSMLACN